MPWPLAVTRFTCTQPGAERRCACAPSPRGALSLQHGGYESPRFVAQVGRRRVVPSRCRKSSQFHLVLLRCASQLLPQSTGWPLHAAPFVTAPACRHNAALVRCRALQYMLLLNRVQPLLPRCSLAAVYWASSLSHLLLVDLQRAHFAFICGAYAQTIV